MSAISIALYVDGRPQQVPQTLTGTHAAARAARGTAWLDLDRPAADDVRSVVDELGVQPLVVEDSGRPHPRSKLERYGDVLLMVLLPARYVEADERVDFGEVQVLIGPDFVVTLRHTSGLDLAALRAAVETRPELLRVGPPAVLHAVVSHVVAAYAPVIAGLQNDIDEIEDEVFGGDPDVSRRIYALTREVIEFQRATAPLIGMLDTLRESFEEQGVAEELRRRLRHVRDDAHRGADRADAFRHSLGDILAVNATLVSQRLGEETKRLTETSLAQNDQVKRISAWAAIGLAPAVISSIYGMNFARMPELQWVWGYPFALVLMLASGLALYVLFRRKHWL
ncbi:MAG TPA: magnesium and cobalt transport protein CorA [Brevibacterium sp.]|nr:magnesium and cobalt transport protein CorA [Brevibacterium sp.]